MGQFGYQDIQGSPLGEISAVVASLPAGPQLGDIRVYNGVTYKLVFNAGGSTIAQGRYASARPVGGGINSVTVTTTSDTRDHLGAVVAHHAAVPTLNYFWGAIKGVVPMIPSANVSAGVRMMCGLSGIITSGPSLPTETVGNRGDILCVSSGSAGTLSGTYLINFE